MTNIFTRFNSLPCTFITFWQRSCNQSVKYLLDDTKSTILWWAQPITRDGTLGFSRWCLKGVILPQWGWRCVSWLPRKFQLLKNNDFLCDWISLIYFAIDMIELNFSACYFEDFKFFNFKHRWYFSVYFQFSFLI